MKKQNILIFLVVLLFGVILPLAVFAKKPPQQINECCRISNGFKVLDIQFDDGCIIGDGSCYMNGAEITLPADEFTDAECKGSGTADMLIRYEHWGLVCLVNTVYTVTNWIFYLMLVFVVIMVVIGGVIYMTAAGDPEKAGKGKSVIIYAIIGLAIALVARLIPSVVKLIVGMG